jgi:hypothetical protein
MADLLVHGGGRVYLLRPVSPAGTAWIIECISENARWQRDAASPDVGGQRGSDSTGRRARAREETK